MTEIPSTNYSKQTVYHVSSIAADLYMNMGGDLSPKEAAEAAAEIFAQTCAALNDRDPAIVREEEEISL